MNEMINIEHIRKRIENISESELKESILFQLTQSDKKLIEDDFEFFIDYLKNDGIAETGFNVHTQYMCREPLEKANQLLLKMAHCFNLQNINIDDTLELIRNNTTLVTTRCSDWNVSEIPFINDSLNRINTKCLYAEFKHVNKWGYTASPSTYNLNSLKIL